MYNGRYNDEHDFIALEVVNGQLLFSFSLGGQVSKVPTFISGGISDGQWHSAHISYFNRVSTMFLTFSNDLYAVYLPYLIMCNYIHSCNLYSFS